MYLSTFGSYTLPPTKVESLVISGQYQDSTAQSDEEDGRMYSMGTNPMLLDAATIQAVHIIGRSFLASAGYAINEGGVDAALFDFAQNVLAGGLKTLTALPSPGTTPHAGLGGAAITSWTCDAETSSVWDTNRHVNGAQAYCEVTVTYLVGSGVWAAHTAGGALTIPLV